jgi:hypothetical protein
VPVVARITTVSVSDPVVTPVCWIRSELWNRAEQ